MIRSHPALKALVVAAAAAVPIGLAVPAQASTTLSDCTVTPKKPVFAGFTPNGVKKVRYDIDVTCSSTSERILDVTQLRREQDTTSPDDHLGKTVFTVNIPSGSGSTTLSHTQPLPNTDLDNDEEVYQRVRFTVTSGGNTSAPTTFEDSKVTTMTT